MFTGSATRILSYTCEQLFELAADVESYPAYLPGWTDVRIIERSGKQLLVRQQLGLRLLRQPFLARAELDRPRCIRVSSNDGPFRDLAIEWRFEPATAGQCRVSLNFSFSLQSSWLEPMAGLLFDQTAPLVMSRFEMRAQQLYAVKQR